MSEVANQRLLLGDETLDVVCERWGCPSRQPELTVRYPYPPMPPTVLVEL
jgi:hypothetical protein